MNKTACLLLAAALFSTGCHHSADPVAPVPTPSAVQGIAGQAAAAMSGAQAAFDKKQWAECLQQADLASGLYKVDENTSGVRKARWLAAQAAMQAHDPTAMSRLEDLQRNGLLDPDQKKALNLLLVAHSPLPMRPGSHYVYAETLSTQVRMPYGTVLHSDTEHHDKDVVIHSAPGGEVAMVSRYTSYGKPDVDNDLYRIKDGVVWQEGDKHGRFSKPLMEWKMDATFGQKWDEGDQHFDMPHLALTVRSTCE
ncbi:MAG: hypothetical protein ACYCW6_19480, partial [Candidatus Xenobia bacterium]